MDELVNEAKALTYEHYCEFALLKLFDGRLVLVRGGIYGIEFGLVESHVPQGTVARTVTIEVEGRTLGVKELAFHTRPKPTGPSDQDLRTLELLGQASSRIYEIFGDRDGTVIRPKKG
ncbi:MAG: hypothetical protein ABSH20_22060 [Tepidisphaeraceae bacterium]